ncbi:hypothetical protein HC251_06460 [Iamia sp. SCSIO 61187]|uniref:HNH endonuclease signature motif containing protein n=1 Tax=Iamia sp. SCSIO 61187 TaxID=2722752 RepID=UPI001C6298A7|nr:HNH endonuclease signature motif containing protein [Iamia sp. SCSIO 61187]QYG92117.1 hypothetical protein HC251_06460 [Iamia sp. SCSIO 61187]
MRGAQDATGGAGAPVDVLAVLGRVDGLLASIGPELVPERVPAFRLGPVVAALGSIERRARGARLVLRKAAADTGEWKARGEKSAAEHVARQEGITVGQAKAELEASERLASLPAAQEAAGRGEISTEQAKVVAQGAAVDPAAEGRLVRTARRGDLRATRDEARKVIARADERSGQGAARIHRRRALKAWVSLDGEGHGVWNIPAESHARVLAALEPYRRQAFRNARDAGERLTDEALMADALDMLARDVLLDTDTDTATDTDTDTDTEPAAEPATAPAAPPDRPPPDPEGPTLFDTANDTDTDERGDTAPPEAPARVVPTAGRRPSTPAPRNRRAPAQVHVLVDFDALRRGYVTTDETCEIHGLGPIPVALARHIMQDSLLRLIVTGTDVTLISSQRRYVPEAVRRALFARDRGTCVVPGCGATKHLELDHCFVDHALGGPTEYRNLAHVCRRDHLLKTLCGWILRHTTEHGWTFTPPTDTDPDPP